MGQTHHTHHLKDYKVEQIWLWHHRLGHPSFGYLKYVFLTLFEDLSVSDFNYETCILTKSHQSSYPSSMNKSEVPFTLMHSEWAHPRNILYLVPIGM